MKSTFFSFSRVMLGLAALVLAPLVLRAQTTITGAAGQVGQAYSYQVTSNATPPVVYTATGLPAGLAINGSSGLITGTPQAAGTFVGSVSLTSGGFTNSAAISITIAAAAGTPSISSGSTLTLTVGTAMPTYTVTATVPTGANPVTSFNVSTLPAGLVLGGTATAPTITGTPTAATNGTPVRVNLSANSASGTGGVTVLSITINAAVGAPVTSATGPSTLALNTAMTPFQISATNSPTSYSASGLPVGLSLNTTTGVISGTPTVAGVYSVSANATNATGTGATVTITLTIGQVSAINSTLAASGNVSSPFSYSLTGTNTPTSFNIGTLPAGLTGNTTTGVITGTPTTTGVSSVIVSANNATGTGPTSTLVITVNAATGGGGSSGGGGGGGGGTTVVTTAGTAPTISSQPTSQSVVEGTPVTFSVSASGTLLSFQWFKGTSPISGAQGASYTIDKASAGDAGTYSVFIANSTGSVTSAGAVLTVTPATKVDAPTITTQPVAQTISSGGSASFSVVATGTAPLSYSWQKDGVAIVGATSASLSLTNVVNTTTANTTASYRVVVSNSAGSVTSNAAVLTVRPPAPVAVPIDGTYFGTIGGNGGSFALIVRTDRTGVFLGFASAARVALVSRDVMVDADGNFGVTQPVAAAFESGSNPAIAAHEGEYHIDGKIAVDGTITGTVSTLNLTFSAPVATRTGATSAVAGFYQTSAVGASGQGYALVGPAGQALVVNVTGTTADGGTGTVTADGAIAVTTAANARVAGTVAADGSTISTTVTPATGPATTFAGANATRDDTEKLTNISTRSLTGTTANTLIAGFVISGPQAKPVLVRAIGPTLTTFGVGGVLSAARLEIFRGTTSVAVGTDWGAATNAAAVAAAAARVGAFALANNSRDAALLLTLEPGAYTAVVTGQNGVSGVSLVEVYDATVGAIPRDQRIVNIATRATAGTGDNSLIAGFFVSGSVPKRLLIRGVGPALTQFGVAGVLARPSLTVNSGNTVLATNAGWSTSPDAAAITTGSAQAGAFALAAGSQDAALIINLAPGAYTAQVLGVGNTTGVALIEVYELP